MHRIASLAQGKGLPAQLVRGGLGSAAVQVLNRLLALALGIVLARGLGAEGYGIYAYAFAIMSLLMVVAEAGVPTLLMREVAASHGQERWGLLRGALIRAAQLVMLASVTLCLAGLLMLWAMGDELSTAAFYTTMLMLLVLPLTALAKTIAQAMLGLHRVVVGQAVAMLLRPLLVLLIVGSIFLFAPALRQPQYAMAVQLGVAVVVVLVAAWMLTRYLPAESRTRPAEYQSRQWLKSALPFTLIGGAAIINNQADIIMLGWFRGDEEVGIYRVAVQGATLVAFGLQATNAVIAPHFARLYAQGDMEKLQRLVTVSARIVLLTALPFALAAVFAGGTIVTWIFGARFAAGHLPLAILAVGQLANAAFGSVGFLLNMTANESYAAYAVGQAAILNVAFNFLIIPFYGMAGAAAASTLTLVIWNFLLYIRVANKLNIVSCAWASNRNRHGAS